MVQCKNCCPAQVVDESALLKFPFQLWESLCHGMRALSGKLGKSTKQKACIPICGAATNWNTPSSKTDLTEHFHFTKSSKSFKTPSGWTSTLNLLWSWIVQKQMLLSYYYHHQQKMWMWIHFQFCEKEDISDISPIYCKYIENICIENILKRKRYLTFPQ